MSLGLDDVGAADGDLVEPALLRRALTAGELTYADGASQVFRGDGTTTYVEGGRKSAGSWRVDPSGFFESFWPPSYRARYEVRWLMRGGVVRGLRFTELGRGEQFDGHFRDAA